MKHLLWGACAAAVIACGGGSRPPTTEPTPKKSACAAAAENVANLVIRGQIDGMTEAQRPGIVRVLTERCEADAWSDEAVACLSEVQSSEEEIEACGKLLTDDQKDAAETQLDRELEPSPQKLESSDDGDMEGGSGSAPKGAPPAPPPPPDDPCGGGA